MMRLDVDAPGLDTLKGVLDRFQQGQVDLSGLGLYYLLERHTPLLELHTMLREGPRNRSRSGLQQSYGDHNRLLLLGLDRLCEGDLAWYRDRLEQPGAVSDDELDACFAGVQSLQLARPALVALWVGAALHDLGMIGGRGAGIDVEDGVAIASELVQSLCPEPFGAVALFAIRNHDYVKDVYRGEIPVSFIAEQVAGLAPETRATAVAILGMIQVAGAASLGEGRLTPFRTSIFRQCFDGAVLDDGSAATRLARLLSVDDDATAPPALVPLLERVPIHRWHRAWDAAGGHGLKDKMCSLEALAALWGEAATDHVVLSTDVALPLGDRTACEVETLLNGTRALMVR